MMSHLWNNTMKITKYGFSETSKWIPFFKKYGVAILGNTPCDTKEENAKFYDELSATLSTKLYDSMYGKIWDTAGDFGEPTNDLAYTTLYLPPHTDMNYVADTPAYQIFTSIIEADKGGETVVVDGKSCAEEFRLLHPDAYEFLTTKTYKYTCSENIHTAEHTIIDKQNDAIHHNDIDMVPVEDEEYHLWNNFTLDPSFRVETKLTPGETIIINNHRVFHSRNEFVGRRNLKGCYFV